MKKNLVPPIETNDIFSQSFLINNVGAPFLIGFAVGYFIKKVLKIGLFLAGAAIVFLFVSEYYGVSKVDDAQLKEAADAASHAAEVSGNLLVERLSSIGSKGVSGVVGFFAGLKLG
jgi:uncharacterized membrane protein (Fun14 family)